MTTELRATIATCGGICRACEQTYGVDQELVGSRAHGWYHLSCAPPRPAGTWDDAIRPRRVRGLVGRQEEEAR